MTMKLNLKYYFLESKKRKGFTVIELLITMFISFILLGIIILLLSSSIKTFDSKEIVTKDLYEGRYILDYISGEIRSGSKIYSIDELNFPVNNMNLGFVIKIYENSNTNRYIFYELKDNKLLRRGKLSKAQDIKDLDNFNQSGTNTICENIYSIEGSGFNVDENIINISVEINEKRREKFETSLYIGNKKGVIDEKN